MTQIPRPSQSELDRLRFAAIIESTDDGIVSKDLDGTVRSWNPGAERIFGYTADEMVGQPIFKVIPPELQDEEHMLLARIAKGEHISHYETERVRKDGRRIRISLTLSPLRDREGRLIGASVIKRDITAHRIIEHQLQQAQRMEAVGRLAGGIAHDFNNLLTIIGGLAGLTADRLGEGTRERRDLEQVVKAAQRASDLTQQLLTFSRRQIAETESIDLNFVVGALESLLRRLLGENIALHMVLAPDLGHIRSNRAQLEQIVMNLAVNARDAMPEGGTITIETRNVTVNGHFTAEQLQLAPGRYVSLSVSDTGQGMDAVTQATIFEPFFTTKNPGQGTGLGLATVYGIVQQAGGAIYVYSEPGHGSVFKVYFPQVDATKRVSSPDQPDRTAEPSGGPRGTVLLVEDEAGVRSFAAQVLAEAGYDVMEAGSGEEALMLAESHAGPIALVLTDVVMPGINGRVLAERLRHLHPGMAVLYTSGYTDDMIVRAGIVTDGSAFLQKPFTPDGLLKRVRTALEKYGAPAA